MRSLLTGPTQLEGAPRRNNRPVDRVAPHGDQHGSWRFVARMALLALVLSLAPQPTLAQQIFGLKSCGSSPGTCGTNFDSEPPTSLYSFAEDGSGFTTIGSVEIAGQPVNADALALHASHGLRAVELVGNPVQSSQLIAIDPFTAVATRVGLPLAREIRGAAFDVFGRLWVLDSANDEILQLDPVLGTTIGTPMGVTESGSSFDVSSVSDIAFRASGELAMVHQNAFYSLDPSTGALIHEFTDVVFDDEGAVNVSHPGIAAASNGSSLFAYDAAFAEDIFEYQSDFARAEIYSDIPPGYNAGRGDLASESISPPDRHVPAVGPLGIGILLVAVTATGSLRLHRTAAAETSRSTETPPSRIYRATSAER